MVNKDIEISCDESVVKRFGMEKRKDYALLLLDLMQPNVKHETLSNNFSEDFIQQRIFTIMKFKKRTWKSILLSAILIFSTCLFIYFSFFVNNVLEIDKEQVMVTSKFALDFNNISFRELESDIEAERGEEEYIDEK